MIINREEFRAVDMWLGKMVKDGRQIVRAQPRAKQQHKVGVKPSLTDCLDGLILVHEMHHSEYACLFTASNIF